MTNNIREDGKPAHVWISGCEAGMPTHSRIYEEYICKNCGVLRGDLKFPETPCKGEVLIAFRNM